MRSIGCGILGSQWQTPDQRPTLRQTPGRPDPWRPAVHTIDGPGDIDAAVQGVDRVLVIGTDSDLAAVLTRLMRTDRLDIEVAHLPGRRGAVRARTLRRNGSADPRRNRHRRRRFRALDTARRRLDDPRGSGRRRLDTVQRRSRRHPNRTDLRPARIARAAIVAGPLRRRRWISGRAVQLGTTGVRVLRDGVAPARSETLDVLPPHHRMAQGSLGSEGGLGSAMGADTTTGTPRLPPAGW